jgi:hypothetical protein
MKKFVKNYIGKGKKVEGLEIVKINMKISDLVKFAHRYKDKDYIFLEVAKLQIRSEFERFQAASNDFNCTMRLNDSYGNVCITSFTPGIKKVIDFLKTSFDASVVDAEKKIEF